jgi:hypothetical protein
VKARSDTAIAVTLIAGLTLPAASRARLTMNSQLSTAGLGSLKIGMTIAQASRATGSPIVAHHIGGPCFSDLLKPARLGVGILGTSYRVAVVTITKRGLATRSGVRVGDSVQRLKSVYGNQLLAVAEFYTPSELQYELRDGNRKVIFFTTKGFITSMTAGRKPEVDYVEGCA